MGNIYEFVIEKLRNRTKPLRVIAIESGIPKDTLSKWVRSKGVKAPRIDQLQKAADYFEREAA